jgi:hypothetical protein
MSRWALSRPQSAQTRSGRPLTFSAAGSLSVGLRRHEKSPAQSRASEVGRCGADIAPRWYDSFRRDGVKGLLGLGRILRIAVFRVGEERRQSVR